MELKGQQPLGNDEQVRGLVQRATATVESCVELRTHSRELITRSAALLAQSDALCVFHPPRSMVHFLKTDSKVGLTFAKIASQRRDNAQGKQSQRSARIAYDTVLGFLQRVRLSDTEAAEIQSRLRELRTALKRLGESM